MNNRWLIPVMVSLFAQQPLAVLAQTQDYDDVPIKTVVPLDSSPSRLYTVPSSPLCSIVHRQEQHHPHRRPLHCALRRLPPAAHSMLLRATAPRLLPGSPRQVTVFLPIRQILFRARQTLPVPLVITPVQPIRAARRLVSATLIHTAIRTLAELLAPRILLTPHSLQASKASHPIARVCLTTRRIQPPARVMPAPHRQDLQPEQGNQFQALQEVA